MTATEQSAEMMRRLHPSRLRFSLFSDQNPLMQPIKSLADTVRANRQAVPADNAFLAMEQMVSAWIVNCLDTAAAARDTMEEQIFLSAYGAPWLQALVGFGPGAEKTLQRADRDVLREANEAWQRSDLETKFEAGGVAAAFIRALIYVRIPEQSMDERGFAVAKAVYDARPVGLRLGMAELKTMFREQFLLLLLDEARAIRALSEMLPPDQEFRQAALAELRRVAAASGTMSNEGARRVAEVAAIFSAGPGSETPAETEAPTAPAASVPAQATPSEPIAAVPAEIQKRTPAQATQAQMPPAKAAGQAATRAKTAPAETAPRPPASSPARRKANRDAE